MRQLIEHLADRANRQQQEHADAVWLAWVGRACGRLDQHDTAVGAALTRLLAAPAVVALLPPLPDPDTLETARSEGYQTGKADAEWVAARTIARLEQAAAEAERTINTLRQTIADEREDLGKANIQAQREADARQTAERQHAAVQSDIEAVRARLEAANTSLMTLGIERDAARSRYEAGEKTADTLRGELDEARS